MSNDFVTASGMDGLTQMMSFMKSLGASKTVGIALHSDERDPNNAEIIRYLAGVDKSGNPDPLHRGPVRDIRPTDDDAHAAANKYLDRVADRMRMIARSDDTRFKKWNSAATAKAVKGGKGKAEAAQASALRAAGKYMQKILSDRVESGNYAAPTSESYAAQREKKYGISPSVALIASGALLKNLQGGRLRLQRRGSLRDFLK